MPLQVIAVATILDTLAHAQRFVEGNLAGGVDHLVVFLDRPGAADQPEVAAYLEAHEHVTCVRAGSGWWADRPAALNERQCTSANLVKHLLAGRSGTWVAHVDGDEVLRLDRRVLERSATGTAPGAARFAVREAVARRAWEHDPHLFKRELDDDELALLVLLGALEEPSNRALFHGHLQGKSAVRTDAEGWLTLHRVVDASGTVLPTVEHDALEVLHFESYDGEDFVRKWTAMARSGPLASYRPGRAATARALRALVRRDLPEPVLRRYLLEVFERTTLDPEELLSDLGLLVAVDVRRPRDEAHRPALDPATLAALREGLERSRGQDLSGLFHGAAPRSRRPAPEQPAEQPAEQRQGASRRWWPRRA